MENHRKKILVVDDEQEVVNNLKHFLSVKEYDVTGAYSGEEALSILEKQKMDLVLLDIVMRGMRGKEVAKTIREKYPDTKIVVVTAYPDEGRRISQDTALEGVVIKPAGIQDIYNKLVDIINQPMTLSIMKQKEQVAKVNGGEKPFPAEEALPPVREAPPQDRETPPQIKEEAMEDRNRFTISYRAKDFSHLLGAVGLSDTLLKDHFRIYEENIQNTNLIQEKIDTLLRQQKDRDPEFADLKRRFSGELNGMFLHEYYFQGLGGKEPLDSNSVLYKKICEDFGSIGLWQQDFTATGMIRGSGWVVLCMDPQSRRLMNVWIDEQKSGHIAGFKPILVLDVYEHAYMLDYRLDRQKYIQDFLNGINWRESLRRFNDDITAALWQKFLKENQALLKV